jgi:hypothetical protein
MEVVRVVIEGKDRKVGAMVKALAVEVSGFEAVTGTTKEFLLAHGFYEFQFGTSAKAHDFRRSVAHYLPGILAYPEG